MSKLPLLKADLALVGEGGQTYDKLLHERFLTWRERWRGPLKEIALKMGYSQAAISQYLNLKYAGDLRAFERTVRTFLRREQHYHPIDESNPLCAITPTLEICEAGEYARQNLKLVAMVGPAGTSKTSSALELKRKYPATVLLTVDLTKGGMRAILRELEWKLCRLDGGPDYCRFESIVHKLSQKDTFIIIDEAHLLKWEAWEIMRSLWDRAPVGILFLGMPRTLSQMRSGKGFLWDQISSRLAISRFISPVTEADVKLLTDSVCPGLSKGCLAFLYEKASQRHRLRKMMELLKRAVQVSTEEGISISLQLLKELADD